MRIIYRKAILSFSVDLTDPDDRPIPIASLLICELEECRFAAAAVLRPPVELDPFAQEHLSDALSIIKEHIDKYVEQNPGAPAQEILGALHHALRNSLFVSEIGDQRVAEIEAEEEMLAGEEIMTLARHELVDAMKRYLGLTAFPAPKPKTWRMPHPFQAQRQESEIWPLAAAATN